MRGMENNMMTNQVEVTQEIKILCPRCRDYMRVITVHTYDSDMTHKSYDLQCPKCGYQTWIKDR